MQAMTMTKIKTFALVIFAGVLMSTTLFTATYSANATEEETPTNVPASLEANCPDNNSDGQPDKNEDGSCKIPTDCEVQEDAQGNAQELNPGSCKILDYLLTLTNVLAALVGVVVVGMIILGGIQYSSSGGDPQKVSAAKKRIFNAVIALVTFIFMYSFLQWIVPGGIF
jgi:heme/copper-type cytochrome/quinol oxidase subunit 2